MPLSTFLHKCIKACLASAPKLPVLGQPLLGAAGAPRVVPTLPLNPPQAGTHRGTLRKKLVGRCNKMFSHSVLQGLCGT